MKYVAKIVLVLILLYTVTFAGTIYLSRRSDRHVEQAWQAVPFKIEPLLQTTPEPAARQAAQIITEEAKNLGLHLNPKTQLQPDPSSISRDMLQAIRVDLRNYLQIQFDRGDDSIDPLPDSIREYLDFHKEQLDRFLLKVESLNDPLWYIDIKKGWEVPVPNYLDHQNLHRLLMAWALHEYLTGNGDKARRIIGIAVRLNRGHARNPVLLSQMMFETIARLHIGVLRKFGIEEDLNEVDRNLYQDHARVLQSFAVEARVFKESALKQPRHLKTLKSGDSSIPEWSLTLFPSYLRAVVLDTTARKLHLIKQLASVTDPCKIDMNALVEDYRASFPGWNPLHHLDEETWITTWARHLLFTLEADLTERVLAVRSAALNDGKWPESLPGGEASPCGEANFDYRILKDGSAWVGLTVKPGIYDKFPRVPLPLSHKVSLPTKSIASDESRILDNGRKEKL